MLDYLNTILEQWPTNYQDRAIEVVSLVRNNAALSSQLSCLLVKKVLRESEGRCVRELGRGTRASSVEREGEKEGGEYRTVSGGLDLCQLAS